MDHYVVGAPSGRILLRGMLDTLYAQTLFMKAQSTNKEYIFDLEKIRYVLSLLQTAEITGMPADEEGAMSGLPPKADNEPDSINGLEACGLNLLRALIRETELSALMVFGVHDGLKICSTLNRLGGAVCAMMCKYLLN